MELGGEFGEVSIVGVDEGLEVLEDLVMVDVDIVGILEVDGVDVV